MREDKSESKAAMLVQPTTLTFDDAGSAAAIVTSGVRSPSKDVLRRATPEHRRGRRPTQDSLAASSWTSQDSSPPCKLASAVDTNDDDILQLRLIQVQADCNALLLDRSRRFERVCSSAISTTRQAAQRSDESQQLSCNGLHGLGSSRSDGPAGLALLDGAARPVRVPVSRLRPTTAYHPSTSKGRVIERYLRQRHVRATLFRELYYAKKPAPGWKVATHQNCQRAYETPAGPAPGWAPGWERPLPLK